MNVLILTDLSEVAKNAGEYAMHFFAGVPANFYLLNIGKLGKEAKGESELQQREEQALLKLNRRIHELQEISSNKLQHFKAFYWEDDLLIATRKFTEEKKIDLIVMGAANKGYSPHTVVGNLTYEVLRKVRCNILIVPENTKYKKTDQILFPVDQSASMDRGILNFINRRGIVKEAGVTVLEIENGHCHSEVEGPARKILKQLKSKKTELKQVKEEDIYEPELLMTVQQNFDMVVMLGKSLSICKRLLHNKRGIYSNVANNLPILVLHK